MQQRHFGSQKFNHAPTKGYNSQPRPFIQEAAPYVNDAQQGLHWALHERKEYEEAYREFETQGTIAVLERPPLCNFDLPVSAHKDRIAESIQNNRLTIILGETGSGKSTQVPQIAYELGFKVIQTQPRRLAASEVAARIGEEISHRWTDVPRDVSAYHTAEKNTITENSRIINATAGTLFAQDMNNREIEDMEVVIHDEVHEWGMDTEMELAHTRYLLTKHPNMRFVIQSATMDPGPIQKYFGEVLGEEPPVIEVPGRTFGVEIKEFPESTSVERAVARAIEMYDLDKKQKAMVAEGYNGPLLPTDFLVVCPGKREISDWTDEIFKALPKEIAASVVIPPLHSKLSYDEQKKALKTDYTELKIVMATNTAKTSLTIDGLAGIVDCGKARHVEIDEDGVPCLTLYATSYADRMQWAGRGGRTAPGWYDLTKMDDKTAFESLADCIDYEVPEAQRINPDRYVLRFAAAGVDFAELKFMHPIDQSVIARAKDSLRVLGALGDSGEITTIGRRMNEFPISANSARMMIEADQYSPQVRAYMAAIVASLEVGGLPMFTHDVGKRWKSLTEEQESDLLAQLDIFIGIQEKIQPHDLTALDLDVKNVQRARETYWKVVRKSSAQIGTLIPPSQEERELIKNCIYAGMPDNVYKYSGDQTYKGVTKDTITPRNLSNRSVVYGKHPYVVGTPRLIELHVDGERKEKHIVETITVVKDIAVLGRVALSHCEWQPTGEIKWRDGKPVQVKKQLYKGVDLGVKDESFAEPSPETRKAVIEFALEHPGSAQKQLRDIKKQLEQLGHLSGDDTKKLTQKELEELVGYAAPADITDPELIDNNLREMHLTIDHFMPAEDRQYVLDNAPAVVSVNGVELNVAYQSGKALVRRYSSVDLANLDDHIFLADGREVLFVYERKRYTSSEIKKFFNK